MIQATSAVGDKGAENVLRSFKHLESLCTEDKEQLYLEEALYHAERGHFDLAYQVDPR